MKQINWTVANKILRSYREGKCKTVLLSNLFKIFNLVVQDDLTTILNITEHHIWFENNSSGFAPTLDCFHVDYEGFNRIWVYAREKEELITEFHLNCVKNCFEKHYEKTKGKRKGKTK